MPIDTTNGVLSPTQQVEIVAHRDSLNPAAIASQIAELQARLLALAEDKMIQRLAIADVVIDDITLANANGYYEIGIQHAARERGCVLISAD